MAAAPVWTEIKASIVDFEIKEITIQANGMATYSFLECGTFKKQPLRKLMLSNQDMDVLNKVIREAEVYSLPSSVGTFIYSLTPCDIQIKTKKHEKSIRLLCLHDPLPATTIELEQEQRAQRVWKAIWDLEPRFGVPKK